MAAFLADPLVYRGAQRQFQVRTELTWYSGRVCVGWGMATLDAMEALNKRFKVCCTSYCGPVVRSSDRVFAPF
jgi:hypothetical protein